MALSNDTTTALANIIEEESRAWAKEWIASRKANMTKRKMVASQELLNSLAADGQRQLSGAVLYSLEMAFADHGRYIDMKRPNMPAGGEDYLLNLESWIVKKGLMQKYLPSYLQQHRQQRETASTLRGMAWAIARTRTKKYRRRAWYAKPKSGGISDLFNRVAAGIPQVILDELKAAFNT